MRRLPGHLSLAALLALCASAAAADADSAFCDARRAADERPSPISEQPGDGLALSLDLTYQSKYVFRGLAVTPDPVLQPSFSAAYKGFSLVVWGNMDATDVNSYRNQFNELDFTLSYAGSRGKFEYAAGGVFYDIVQETSLNTTEVFVSGGLRVPGRPALAVYQDADEVRGTYLVVSFGHTFADVWRPAKGVAVSVSLGTTFAWGSARHNSFYYGAGQGGWGDATVSLGLPVAIGDRLEITPAIHWSALMSDRLKAATQDSDNFWAGVSLKLSF